MTIPKRLHDKLIDLVRQEVEKSPNKGTYQIPIPQNELADISECTVQLFEPDGLLTITYRDDDYPKKDCYFHSSEEKLAKMHRRVGMDAADHIGSVVFIAPNNVDPKPDRGPAYYRRSNRRFEP